MYEAVVYSNQAIWSWRIEDPDGKTVKDGPTFTDPTKAMSEAIVNRDVWNSLRSKIETARSGLSIDHETGDLVSETKLISEYLSSQLEPEVVNIATSSIHVPEGYRIRQKFDIETLKNAINETGLIKPIKVRRDGSGQVFLVHGERRLLACQELKWETIPVIFVDPQSALNAAYRAEYTKP